MIWTKEYNLYSANYWDANKGRLQKKEMFQDNDGGGGLRLGGGVIKGVMNLTPSYIILRGEVIKDSDSNFDLKQQF